VGQRGCALPSTQPHIREYVENFTPTNENQEEMDKLLDRDDPPKSRSKQLKQI
jgi:hypothetical protein